MLSVRDAVAGNKNVPGCILANLSEDGDVFVRNADAINRNMPSGILEKMSYDKEKIFEKLQLRY